MESREQSNRRLSTESLSRPSAIVIGGGFAGIAAARALHDASFQVVLLESRDRIGGRVCTDYSFGFPVDMGASWLHGVCEENPLAPLIGRLGLPLYRTSGDNSVLYDHDLESYALFDTDGNQVPQELVTEVGNTFGTILKEVPLSLPVLLCMLFGDLNSQVLGHVLNIGQDAPGRTVKPTFTYVMSKIRWGDISLTEKVREENSEDMSILKAFSIVLERRPDLRQEGTAHNVLQWYLCRMEGWFAADADSISLKYWDEEELLSGGHGLMVRGYYPVINTLAKGLDIRLNSRVTSISRRHSGVKVGVEDGSTFTADAAIVAVPLGVLKSKKISFEPRLPQWKEKAISELGIGTENKIALHFDKVFWPNVEFLGVVASSSYGCSYFLNLHKATSYPVLVYMPAGRLAQDIEKMSDKDAANFAYMQLKKILPDASEPINYLVSHWGTDINSLGSYSYHTVGKSNDLYERLRIPVDNIFFAGEATSMNYPGTVHGAFSTGTIAAEDCRMRVLERYGELDLHNLAMDEEMSTSLAVPLLISRM